MPIVYVFTQTEKSKSEAVAKNIQNIHQEHAIRVIESTSIDGYYKLPGGFFLQDSNYTTASKIELRHDVKMDYFRECLKSLAGVIDPLILIQREEAVPLVRGPRKA